MLKSNENGVYAEEQVMGGGQSKLDKLALFRISYTRFGMGSLIYGLILSSMAQFQVEFKMF